MERLEPILKQKFWILLGVGILMTITGWWMATGSLAATITARTEAVKAAFALVPTDQIPSNDWSMQLAVRNTEQERAVSYTKALLWERQRGRMTWPEAVAPFAWQNGYRGEIPLAGRENYRVAYGFDVLRVWLSVHPFNQLDGSGIVSFGQDQRVLPQRIWGNLAPSSADMWDAQEDLWLLESLLQVIVDVNGGPNAQRGDASVHVIEKLELHGGQPAAQRKSATAAGPGGGPGAGPGMGAKAAGGGVPMSGPGGFGGGSAGGGEGGSRSGQLATADFDYKEELGDDGSGASRGAGGGGLGGGGMSGGPSGAHSAGGPGPGGPGGPGPGGPGASSAGGAANAVRRYIDDDAALPYKTRGFYMTVVMDHRKIPGLIAELTASEKSAWPVEIVRVQMVRLHDNDVDNRGGGAFGPGGGGRPGVGPGFGPGGIPGLAATGESEPVRDLANVDNPNAASQAAAGAAALDAALQDPFISRVAICGIITLYKEVKPEAVAPAAQPAVPGTGVPAPATGATPPANPANPAAPVATPAAAPAAASETALPPTSSNPPATDAKPDGSAAPAAPVPNGGAGAAPDATPKPPAPGGNG